MTSAMELMRHRRPTTVVDRAADGRDELLAVLPHLRRLPERVDRILTLTGRGELRVRTVIDEDSRRIVRTLVNRPCSAASAPPCSLVSAILLVATDAGPGVADGTGLFEIFGYGGLLAGAVLAPAGRRRCRPGRNDMSTIVAIRLMTSDAAGDVGLDRPPAGRALLPAPRRRRPARRLGRGDAVLLACSSSVATGTSTGCGRPRRGRDGRSRARPRAPARGRPGRRRRSCRSPSSRRCCPPSLAPHSACSSSRGGRRRAVAWSLLDAVLDVPGPVPGRCRRRRG